MIHINLLAYRIMGEIINFKNYKDYTDIFHLKDDYYLTFEDKYTHCILTLYNTDKEIAFINFCKKPEVEDLFEFCIYMGLVEAIEILLKGKFSIEKFDEIRTPVFIFLSWTMRVNEGFFMDSIFDDYNLMIINEGKNTFIRLYEDKTIIKQDLANVDCYKKLQQMYLDAIELKIDDTNKQYYYKI